MSMSGKDQIRAAEDRHYRDLWVAVVLQAKDDIENEPLHSINFTQAVAFFIGSGEWVKNRTAIGDYLDLHRDDLEKMGRRCINARRVSEGLAPLLPRQPWPVAARALRPVGQRPVPQAPSLTQRRQQPTPAGVNPFFPRGIYAAADAR
jgi:hypothetical protein